jgi:hypothetical protein
MRAERKKNGRTDRHRQAGRQTNRQTNRQTGKEEDRQTDMTKLIFAFLNFANAPKNLVFFFEKLTVSEEIPRIL